LIVPFFLAVGATLTDVEVYYHFLCDDGGTSYRVVVDYSRRG